MEVSHSCPPDDQVLLQCTPELYFGFLQGVGDVQEQGQEPGRDQEQGARRCTDCVYIVGLIVTMFPSLFGFWVWVSLENLGER